MNKIRKNKHYQISLYIQSRNKTFLLFLFWLQLFSSNAWTLTSMPFVSLGFSAFRQEPTPHISSPVLRESHPRESGRFGEKVRAKAFPSGLSLANALWSVLGQRRAGHGGDCLSRGSSLRHLYVWKFSLWSWVGAQLGWPPVMLKTPNAPQCLELKDLHLWVMLAL